MSDLEPFQPGSLLRKLVERGVDFVVVGGIAVVAHGYIRLTRDLDVTYATDPANLDALGEVLVGLNTRLLGVEEEVPFVADGATLRHSSILTLMTDEGRIDLLARPAGSPTYARLRERASRLEIAGVVVSVASIDDLIAMKEETGRPQDGIDIEGLLAVKRTSRRLGR